MPLVYCKSVRCHSSKLPSLRGRIGSLDHTSECNAWPIAFTRLKTVNFNCEHCLERGQLAKDVHYFQIKWGLLGRQNAGCCLVLHRYPAFAMKRYSTVRWVFAVTVLSWSRDSQVCEHSWFTSVLNELGSFSSAPRYFFSAGKRLLLSSSFSLLFAGC